MKTHIKRFKIVLGNFLHKNVVKRIWYSGKYITRNVPRENVQNTFSVYWEPQIKYAIGFSSFFFWFRGGCGGGLDF